MIRSKASPNQIQSAMYIIKNKKKGDTNLTSTRNHNAAHNCEINCKSAILSSVSNQSESATGRCVSQI